jgi:hypothetical protein
VQLQGAEPASGNAIATEIALPRFEAVFRDIAKEERMRPALRLSDRDRIFSIAHLPSRSVDLASRFCEADRWPAPKARVAPSPELTISQDPSPGIGIALDEIEPVAIEMLAWWKSAKAKGRQTVRKSRHMSIHQTLNRSAAARKQLRGAEGADVH